MPRTNRERLERLLLLTLGWALVALGVVGLFLPVLQGVLFILAGLSILSHESKTAQRWLERLRRRFPKADERLHLWGDRLRSVVRRRRGKSTGDRR
jgi:uncharacterized protein